MVTTILATWCVCSPSSAADLEVSASTHYSYGDYGGSDAIDIVYAPLVARLDVDAWTFKAVLPFLYVDGGSATVNGPGGPITTNGGSNGGLGDMLAEAAYWIAPGSDWAPYVEIGAGIKFPTGDEDDGLGTGQFDFVGEAGVTQSYGAWTPYLGLGFRVLGDAKEVTYRDGFLATVGVFHATREWLDLGMFLYWREAATKSNDDSIEWLPTARVEWTEHWVTDVYVSVGLTESSPDVGTGLQFLYRFPDLF